MIDISAHSHLQCSGQGFEYPLDFVMFVLSLCLDIEVHPRTVTETLEEMQEHLCRHIPHLLSLEGGIPH